LDRKVFGKTISTLYAIQEKIADISTRLDAARLLTHKAALLKDTGKVRLNLAVVARVVEQF